MKIKLDGDIAVIGYPKSGNTWLTRLVARCLKLNVDKYVPGDHTRTIELASDVNNSLSFVNEKYVIRKLHMYPEEFEKNISGTKYIIYIKRDPRAVFISAFFYFRYAGEQEYAYKAYKIWPFSFFFKRLLCRRQLVAFLNEFISIGIKPFERCDQHIDAWRKYARTPNIKFYEVNYEDLLLEPNLELKKIFKSFNISYDFNGIKQAVELESFSKRKAEVQSSNVKNLIFGKDFNNRFLRSGNNEDWKKYLTDSQAKKLKKLKR